MFELLPGPLRYCVCDVCREALPLTAEFFPKRKSNVTGLLGHCKKCFAKKRKNSTNREKIKNWKERMTAKNTQSPIIRDPRITKICSSCPGEKPLTEFVRRNNTKCGFEGICLSCKAIIKQNRRMALLGQKVSNEEWSRIQSYFDNRCCYCYSEAKLTLDHFIPVSRGGAHSIKNIVPACLKCNLSKSAHNPYDWVCREFHHGHFMMSFDFNY
jgi:5-methylcytosine-specific restriction endonuclease McrA